METIADLKIRFKDYSEDKLFHHILEQEDQIAFLRQKLYGRSTERSRYMENQPCIFDEVEALNESSPSSESDDSEEIQVSAHTKKRGKRSKLPLDLPRERVEHDLNDDEKHCAIHGTELQRIGETKTEKLEIVPASVKVIEDVTFAYKCPCCLEDESSKGSIINSKADAELIPKSFATPSLLSYLVCSKYADGLPLYRQEAILKRLGIDLGRTTIARWMIHCGKAAQPLLNLMAEDQLERLVLGCDETPIQVLNEPNRLPQQKSYIWVTTTVYGPPIILYHYYPHRGAKVAENILRGFKGVVVCDGLKSYDSFANAYDITLAGCMAHIRRLFVHAEKAAKKANPKGTFKASQARAMIKALYEIERKLKDQPPDKILAVRSSESQAIMEKFKKWLDDHVNQVLPKSLLGKAIHYALGQWHKMLPFLSNPYIPIDNNVTEGRIRPFVVGRKNWLFSQSQSGAEASAALYSLIESAKANNLDPFCYLSLIFKELPKAQSIEDYDRLMPHKIAAFHTIKPLARPN